mgnify:CR=1 FL=1
MSHCEAGEDHWLLGEAALLEHSIRDADPRPVITRKKVAGMDKNVFNGTIPALFPPVSSIAASQRVDKAGMLLDSIASVMGRTGPSCGSA